MTLFPRRLAALTAAAALWQTCQAQSGTPAVYTDPDTGITFDTWTVAANSLVAGLTFGVALPEDALTTDATEFIGYLSCGSANGEGTGWCGLSLGGVMNGNLLLMAYPYEDDVLTSFRFGSGYVMPDVYTGDANLTQISSNINSTHFTLIFRCEGCLSWDNDGTTGSAKTSSGRLVLGWSQAAENPGDGACPDDLTLVQHDSQSIWVATLDANAVSASYSDWAALATNVVTGSCDGSGGGNTTEPTGTPVPEGITYDYIIVGGGAGGIPMADRLSEAGHSVLLIEKGPPSLGIWGGTMKPAWLEGTDLTRFDVPGLCNEIWVDSAGIACDDHDQMSGCILGGGTAINSGLWWNPYNLDFDVSFPNGWKYSEMKASIAKAFARIPGTAYPSQDGILYLQEGPNVILDGLLDAGWSMVSFIDKPNLKYRTIGHTPYMFSNGQRNGPLGTYLVTANARDNMDMWLNTTVRRVIRDGSTITGVEVEPTVDGGYEGIVNVTPSTGKVILSAGAFGTPKILWRSGIGLNEQLAIVQSSTSDGDTMIDSSQWINLPVGENLMDHPNTEIVVQHPDIVFYDFYAAYDDPIEEDKNNYLNNRSGPLAQSAPNVSPIFFDQVVGPDNVTRQLEWQARVEGSHDIPDGQTMTITQYVGRGMTSRGKLTINGQLNTVVSVLPWLTDANDVDAVIQGIERLQASLANVTDLTWAFPTADTSIPDFVNSLPLTGRGSNHWMGSCKMGSDDGRRGGTAVVDLNTKVYGTNNLFVVDASIIPGMISTNPTAYIVSMAEHAAVKIMAL